MDGNIQDGASGVGAFVAINSGESVAGSEAESVMLLYILAAKEFSNDGDKELWLPRKF